MCDPSDIFVKISPILLVYEVYNFYKARAISRKGVVYFTS